MGPARCRGGWLRSPGPAGTWRWIASYGGDVNNNAVASACQDVLETAIVYYLGVPTLDRTALLLLGLLLAGLGVVGARRMRR